MRVIVKRFFISTVFGNVDRGRVLDVSDAHGKHFIDNGLADEIKSAEPVDFPKAPEEKPSGFSNPGAAIPEPGLSSPVAPALPKETVKSPAPGAKRKPQKKGSSR